MVSGVQEEARSSGCEQGRLGVAAGCGLWYDGEGRATKRVFGPGLQNQVSNQRNAPSALFP